MEALKQYVISVAACAILCGIAATLMPKGPGKDLTALLCSLFMATTLIQPLEGLQLDKINFSKILTDDSPQTYLNSGEESAREALTEAIRQQTENLVLQKAKEIDAEIKVTVHLSGEEIPVPQAVTVFGSVTKAQRSQLEEFLSNEIGISKEYQTWKE